MLSDAIAKTNQGVRINEVNIFKVMEGRSVAYSINIEETEKSHFGIAIRDYLLFRGLTALQFGHKASQFDPFI